MKKKTLLYCILLILGILTFISEIFIFQKPDGILGLSICLISIYLILGSLIKLCKMSKKISNTLLASLDILFWLP